METIYDIVRKLEAQDETGTTRQSEYVQFSLRSTLNTIDAYLNSKHISGDTDSMGREKPFFNIVISAANIWYRATDIDRKNISVKATKMGHMILSFFATILLQKYMRKTLFGQFLNEWGRILARYGSAVLKFVEKDGEMKQSVLPWSSILCDSIDFENNIQVEKLYFTPAQLKQKKGYDQSFVQQLLDNTTTRKTKEGSDKDIKDDYILIYECHGLMPLSFLTDKEEDEHEFVQQMHVICYQERKEKAGDYDQYTLYRGREAKSPYMITHLIKEDDRTLAKGAVEHLFDAQWMVNDNVKKIKDQLDLASKIFFQTSDGTFLSQNALRNLQNGDILIHRQNEPLTQLNNTPNIAAMQASMGQWQSIGIQINGISEAMQGQNAPAGTAWRQVEALLNESHSLFELMTENKGFYIEQMLTNYIIPHLKKKIDNKEEIAEILEEHQIKFIDSRYIPNAITKKVFEKMKKTILGGEVYTGNMQSFDTQQAQEEVKNMLSGMGRQRFIKPDDIDEKTWKDVLKDLEWELEIDITNEQKDKQSIMATLNTLLQTITNPIAVQVLQTDEGKLIMSRILEMSGAVSPIEISQLGSGNQQPAPQPQQPTQMQPMQA